MRAILIVPIVALIPTLALAGPKDPAAIIRDIYKTIGVHESYEPPRDIYTPRLAKLFADDVADAKGEVGRLDGSIWFNAQDFKYGVSVSGRSDEFRKDRQIVTAKVVNFGKPETAVFYFERQNGRWLIDDLQWTGKDEWVLSLVLKYGNYHDSR